MCGISEIEKRHKLELLIAVYLHLFDSEGFGSRFSFLESVKRIFKESLSGTQLRPFVCLFVWELERGYMLWGVLVGPAGEHQLITPRFFNKKSQCFQLSNARDIDILVRSHYYAWGFSPRFS